MVAILLHLVEQARSPGSALQAMQHSLVHHLSGIPLLVLLVLLVLLKG